jgi:hypothetical protein
MSREVRLNPEEEPLLPADNPLIRELIDSVLREAQRIVKENTSQFTAEQLIEAAQFWIPGDMPRLKKRKPQAWNLGLKNEKAFAPPELLKKKPGVGKNGKAGLDGGYAKWFADRWKNEPELREKYQQMAAVIGAAGDDDGAENDEQPEETRKAAEETRKAAKKRLQKNETKQLLKQVHTIHAFTYHVVLTSFSHSCKPWSVRAFTLLSLVSVLRFLMSSNTPPVARPSSIITCCASAVGHMTSLCLIAEEEQSTTQRGR